MKQKLSLLTISRQQELIRINRVLAGLVVILAFSTGLLLALREELLVSKATKMTPSPEIMLATSSGSLTITTPSVSPFSTLLQSARYDRVLESKPLTQSTLFKLLWAAQGKITSWGERTVPSYKSAYPLSVLVFVRKVEQTPSGWYRFNAETQQLEPEATMPLTLSFPDTLPGLLAAPMIIMASIPANLATDELTWNEAGGMAQNILLAATEEHLATFLLPSSSLSPTFTSQLKLSGETILWLMPVGPRKSDTH